MKKKVVHLSFGNYGGVIFQYSCCINKKSDIYSSRCIFWNNMYQCFENDILYTEDNIEEINKIIDEADIIHYHDLDIVNYAINKFPNIKDKKSVITHHGILLRLDSLSHIKFHKQSKIKYSVSTPDLLYYLPDAIWIRHPIDPEKYSNLEKFSEGWLITHSSSILSWNSTYFIKDLIFELQKEFPDIELEVFNNIPFQQVIAKKAKAKLNIGRFLGWYAMGDLESMILGIPDIAFLNNTTLEFVKDIPIINCIHDEVYENIKKLKKDENLRKEVGIASREWVLKNHNFDITYKNLEDLYA